MEDVLIDCDFIPLPIPEGLPFELEPVTQSGPVDSERTRDDLTGTPPVRTRRMSSGPGCLHTVSLEERGKLFHLWSILDQYFLLEYHKLPSEKLAVLSKQLWEGKGIEPFFYEYAHEHPLYFELYRYASTDDLDTVLLRFLRARKWRVQEAFATLIECLSWRHEFGIDRIMREGEATIGSEPFESGVAYVWGEDRDGRLVCYIRAKHHEKHKRSVQENVKLIVYFMEVIRTLRRHDEQLLTAVIDFEGAGLSSFDLPLAQFLTQCAQACYPEILGTVLILNAPWIFWGFWACMKRLLDPIIVSKVAFIKPSELCEFVDPLMIPADFGGQSSFRYHYYPDPDPQELPTKVDEELQRRLYQLGQELCLRSSQIHSGEGNLPVIISERNRIKAQLRYGYHRLLQAVYPPNIYHRWGVFNDDGCIDWSLYKGPQIRHLHMGELEQCRASAPPELV